MGYLHIDNLYKAQEILAFRTCFALEKIHGTSANVARRRRGLECQFMFDLSRRSTICQTSF